MKQAILVVSFSSALAVSVAGVLASIAYGNASLAFGSLALLIASVFISERA